MIQYLTTHPLILFQMIHFDANTYTMIMLALMVLVYVCVVDSNVWSWITIKVEHALIYIQLQYIRFVWMFKKF